MINNTIYTIRKHLLKSPETFFSVNQIKITSKPTTIYRTWKCPNCHSHAFSSYMLLPLLPDSRAVSVLPYGNQ